MAKKKKAKGKSIIKAGRSVKHQWKKDARHMLIIPAVIVWLELILHIFDSADLQFFPIYALFGISLGLIISAALFLLKPKAARKSCLIISIVLSFFYCVEYTAKAILQTYYPFSVLGTAAENKLYQFIGIIVQVVARSIPMYLLSFLPVILMIVLYKKGKLRDSKGKNSKYALIALACAAAFHLMGFGVVNLPWDVDVTPESLYSGDVSYNDQVEVLGLYNFIRLDIKNQIIPSKSEDFDPSAIATIEEPAAEATTTEAAVEKPVTYEKNIMDIDFDALAAGTTNKDMQWLSNYFGSCQPTFKNEYTGMFEGYNLVFLTVESMSGYAVSEKYTPTLYKMMNQGFKFNNFYTALHYTSTSNGECQNLLGLYPKNGNPITIKRTGELKDYMYFALAQQLGRKGYSNWGYHDNWDLYGRMYSHSNLGYYWQFIFNGLVGEKKSNGDIQWPQRDTYMIDESASDFVNSEEPFNVYYITVSGHTPYGWNWATSPYKELLADSGYSDKTNAYIASVVEADRAVEKLVKYIDEAGKLDKTLFVVVPDHIPYSGVECLNEIAGVELGSSEAARAINEAEIDFDLYKSSLIIWSASMTEPVEVNKVCCQVDILPTISNLMGLEYDSRMLSGKDILSTAEGLVVFSSKSWLTDRGLYNRYTKEFTQSENSHMTESTVESYVESMKTLVNYKLDCTAKIVETDYYNYVFGDSTERIYGEICKGN